MQRIMTAAFIPALFSVLVSCGGNKSESTLVLTGSSTVAPLAAEIGKRFEGLHPGVHVDVQTGGSARGIADARKGTADIGMVSRALKPSEQDLKSFTIARDGVCLILNSANKIKNLSDADVVAIFTGKIKNWKDLGGSDRPITVVNKAEGRATLDLFLHHFKLKNSQIKAQMVIGDNEMGIKAVAGNPDAIGYVSIGIATYDAAHGIAIKSLPVAGVAPTLDNVRQGLFPISRQLNLVSKSEPEGLALQFITFARSQDVVDLIKNQNFVPLAP